MSEDTPSCYLNRDDGEMGVEKLSGWELRQRAEGRGTPVSGKQFRSYQEWGLIPERPGGGWIDADVERLVRIRQLRAQALSMHRRVILLRDLRWPTPPAKLRQAMIETIPSIKSPKKKTTALYRAVRIRHGEVSIAKAVRIRLPPDWGPPERAAWQDVFRWPEDANFDLIAGSVYSDVHALVQSPLVTQSTLLADIPFEEVVILLMTRQLSLPPQIFPELPVAQDTEEQDR